MARELERSDTTALDEYSDGEFIARYRIDGSHVAITAPASNEEVYVNRKLFHSINIQAICDHEFRFIDSVVMWPGVHMMHSYGDNLL